MPLTGIANENEFYSAYYLDAILQEDLKGVAQRWREQAQTPSPVGLAYGRNRTDRVVLALKAQTR